MGRLILLFLHLTPPFVSAELHCYREGATSLRPSQHQLTSRARRSTVPHAQLQMALERQGSKMGYTMYSHLRIRLWIGHNEAFCCQ
eukprot:6203873-Pleurochrysis_carterae.AAC.4